MGLLILSHHHLYLLEQIRSEDKFVELFVCAIHYHCLVTFPFRSALADENDIVTDTHYGVHVVGVDDGSNVKFFGDTLKQFVDD